MESAELLSLCVRRVRGLKSVRLVDASWIWQEPHSRRLKMKLTIARDVLSGRTLQQSFVVDFVVKTRLCNGCTKAAANDTWQSKVQLRQRADHPRTLLAMEQEMRRRQHEVRAAIDIKRTKEGLDLTFLRRQDAQRFVHLLHSIAPCRTKASASVVATNAKTGTSNVKHTWSVEVAPCCRGDLVLLPKGCAGGPAGGGRSRWAIVTAVGASVHLVDPTSGHTTELSSEAYWRHPFVAVASRDRLTTFVVLDVDTEGEGTGRGGGGPMAGGGASSEGAAGWLVTEATVARERDLGANDETFFITTHLGGRLEAGDEALGYDLEAMTHLEAPETAPPAILLEKKAERKKARAKRGSAATRRRRRKEGAADDSSMVTTTSYQTELGDALDDLSVFGEDDEVAAIGEAFGTQLASFVEELEASAEDDSASVAGHETVPRGTSLPPVAEEASTASPPVATASSIMANELS